MKKISPDGDVYQGGTLSGNPVAMAAGFAQLEECLKNNFYSDLENKTKMFVDKLNTFSKNKKYPFKVFSIGSVFWFAFTEKDVIRTSEDIDPASMNTFGKLYHDMLQRGIYFGPSGYEVGFISAAHTKEILDAAAQEICNSLDSVFEELPERVSKV
jgi:glutamate-1-semialdehyde 2,1-aminomutase